MNHLIIPLAFFVLCCTVACQKDETITSHEHIYISPLSVSFELQDTGQTVPIAYLYQPRVILDTDTFYYSWNELGEWHSNNLPPEQYVRVNDFYQGVAFYLRFQASETIQFILWRQKRADFLFQEGRIFSFGIGPDKVDVGAVLGSPESWNDVTSRASFLNYPQGELLITEVAPYYYQNRHEKWIVGHLVHCSFEGKLGRYDQEGVELVGQDSFKTNVQITLQNGKAVFFIPAI